MRSEEEIRKKIEELEKEKRELEAKVEGKTRYGYWISARIYGIECKISILKWVLGEVEKI